MTREDAEPMEAHPRVGLWTCRTLPEPDADEELLLGALDAVGLPAVMIGWDAPAESPGVRGSEGLPIDIAQLDVGIIRSTWNYIDDPERFARWLRDGACRAPLWNRSETCLWNFDKHYLASLEKAGVPIVPTWFVDRGADFDLATRWGNSDWDTIVIKPTISAGSFATRMFTRDESREAVEFLEAGRDARDWLVQRYEPAVETTGERAIVAIDGEVSHAVRKSARFSGDAEVVSDAYEPTERERDFAATVLGEVREPTLFARVDVIEDATGVLRLAELELLEPSLFLKQSPTGLERFVAAIERRSSGDRGA